MNAIGTYQPFHKTMLTVRRGKCALCETKYLINDINGFLETYYVDAWRHSAFGYFDKSCDDSWHWLRSPCCKSIMSRTRFLLGEEFKMITP